MILNFYYRFYECRKIYQQIPDNREEWSPPIFFRVFYSYTNILFYFSTWNILWRHTRSLSELLEFPTYRSQFRTNFLNKIFGKLSFIVSIIMICLSVILTILGVGLLGTYNSQTHTSWFSRYIQAGKDLLFITNDTSYYKTERFSYFEITLGVVTIFCYYLRHLVGIFEEFLTLIIILPLWVHVLGFITSLQDAQASSWSSIRNEYLHIKRIIDKVNHIIWAHVFLHILIIVFAYSYTLTFIFNSIMPSKNETTLGVDKFVPLKGHQLRFFVKFVINVLKYYCSADINCKVKYCITITRYNFF